MIAGIRFTGGIRSSREVLRVAGLIMALALRIPSAILSALLCAASAPCAQELLDNGWWVVVANFPQDAAPTQMEQDRNAFLAKLKHCGFKPFNDFSMKFSNFRPGFTVFVLGAVPTRHAAGHVKAAVASCAPAAYVKAAKYAGE